MSNTIWILTIFHSRRCWWFDKPTAKQLSLALRRSESDVVITDLLSTGFSNNPNDPGYLCYELAEVAEGTWV